MESIQQTEFARGSSMVQRVSKVRVRRARGKQISLRVPRAQGSKSVRPHRAQGTWYKRHKNHERKEVGHIKKGMCETQQHVRHKAQKEQEPRKARTLSNSFYSEASLPNQLYIWDIIWNKLLFKVKKLFSFMVMSKSVTEYSLKNLIALNETIKQVKHLSLFLTQNCRLD